MVKKDLNIDLLRKKVESKYIFFVQLWHELLDQRTLDTYQYKLLNSYSALCELITVIDKTRTGIFTSSHNIIDCVDECAQIVKSDIILKKNNQMLWNRLVNHLSKHSREKNEQLALKFQVEYAISELKEQYSVWIHKELNTAISDDNKESIIYCTKALISQCIYNGWSTKSLYKCDRFFYKYKDVPNYDSMQSFSNYLSSGDKEFIVYISVSNFTYKQPPNIINELEKLDFTIKSTDQIKSDYRDDNERLIHLFESSKAYFSIDVKAKDIYSSAYKAVQILSDKINVLSFYNIIDTWDISNIKMISVDNSSAYGIPLTSSDLFKTYDYIDTSGFIFENTVKIMNDHALMEIIDKLRASFSYANISRASLFQQEKYMTLWIALESLSRTEMYDDIISNVKNTVPAALSTRYLFRIIRNFAEDLIRCNIDLRFNGGTFYDIKDSSKTKVVSNLIAIIKNDILYPKLEEKCNCSDLLHYRINEIKTILTDVKYAVCKFTNYHQHISWQIQRLYRIRNEIAHSATIDKNSLTIYTEHLFDYLSTFVSEIVSCTQKSKFKNIGEIYCKIQDNYAVFQELVKFPDKITDVDKQMLDETLFKTGVLDFI
ncbi:MAG: hypothetical protein J6O50_07815 [Ruminiclostridium sp.]|nr:hypothetical protein [Ruminiclostridium sp.]